jgi:hypothetical protein
MLKVTGGGDHDDLGKIAAIGDGHRPGTGLLHQVGQGLRTKGAAT